MVISCKYADSVGGVTPHYHDCHQLLYIVEGKAKVSVGAEQTIAEGGTLTLDPTSASSGGSYFKSEIANRGTLSVSRRLKISLKRSSVRYGMRTTSSTKTSSSSAATGFS